MSNLKESYSSNYIKTYFWQGIGILLHLISLFIVIPFITGDKVVYGIYSICISTSMFLSYADLGFVSASLKYAGEFFAKGDLENEVKYYGFSSFILFIFVGLISAIYIGFAVFPDFLIKDISNEKYLEIASNLLFIQAFFAFNTVLQRFVSGVFQVRVEQFVYQRINIIGSILKIFSVFFFFGENKYDIVGYFLFIKIIEFLIQGSSILLISKRYEIPIMEIIKSVRFDKTIYYAVKSLAFGSLFVTVAWVLYYELDIIIIGRWFGPAEVAVFALSFTFIQFFRSISSVVLSPFQSRYNHFIGVNNSNGLRDFVKDIIQLSMPIFVFSVVSILFLADNLVLSWAGSEYLESGLILQLLLFTFIFSFINVPGANVLIALERVKEMYKINFIIVIVYWGGVFLFKDKLGLLAFPLFKLIAGMVSIVFYTNFVVSFLKVTGGEFFKITILRVALPVIIQSFFLYHTIGFLTKEKGVGSLAEVVVLGVVSVLIALLTLLSSSKFFRSKLKIEF